MKKWFIFLGLLIVAAIAAWLLWPHTPAEQPVDLSVNKNYVAMGDSVAAGAGLTPAVISSGDCDRSGQAYATAVASSLHLQMTNIACSGATLAEGILGVQPADTDSQLNKLFALPTPSLISLTIGANDAHWIQVLQGCFQQCSTPDMKTAFDSDVKTISGNLKTFYQNLSDHYDKAVPHVYVTGYYSIFPTGIDSLALRSVNLSAKDVSWIESLRAELNETIEQAGKGYNFVTYVPVSFSGHELLSNDSWVQGTSAAAPLHPNAEGQVAIGKAIVSAIKADEK